jgi:hypothetical protein
MQDAGMQKNSLLVRLSIELQYFSLSSSDNHAPAAGIAQSVLRQATDWTARIRLPVGARDIFLLHSVQDCL